MRAPPEGERIELFDSDATNVGFTPDAGITIPIAERHNKPIAVPIASHHFHLYLPDEARVAKAKEWYAKTFGGTPGKRWRYDASICRGSTSTSACRPQARAADERRMLDPHRIRSDGLEAFTKKDRINGRAARRALSQERGRNR
jgi:hypothetical protein